MPAILALTMLPSQLGEQTAPESVEKAVIDVVVNKLKGVNAGQMGYSTSEVGDLIAEGIA